VSDESLRRADGLLSELIELIETARALPMSASCVVPRERVLDLLDELREVLPPEMDQARTLIARRDQVLRDSLEQAAATRERAVAEADTILADAGHRAEATVAEAEVQSRQLLAAARDEHARLISATAVHEGAAAAASALRADAEAYQRQVTGEAQHYDQRLRADADSYAQQARSEAERYAIKLTADAENYAERTLDDLAAVLHRSAQTAEQGRTALAQRRATAWTSQGPVDDAAPADAPSVDGAADDGWSSISA
jgi:cell division septum initiation protein DivIVA